MIKERAGGSRSFPVLAGIKKCVVFYRFRLIVTRAIKRLRKGMPPGGFQYRNMLFQLVDFPLGQDCFHKLVNKGGYPGKNRKEHLNYKIYKPKPKCPE